MELVSTSAGGLITNSFIHRRESLCQCKLYEVKMQVSFSVRRLNSHSLAQTMVEGYYTMHEYDAKEIVVSVQFWMSHIRRRGHLVLEVEGKVLMS